MVSREMIWRCHPEVRRACSSSCLLFEICVCHSCTSTTGHSSWGRLSRSPLQLQLFWVTVAPVTHVWREKTIPLVLFCVPPAAQVVTKAGSRGWPGSMGFAKCKSRDWNIQVKTLVRRGWNAGNRSQEKTVAESEQKGLAMGVSYPSDLYSMHFACCCSGSPSGRCPSWSPGEPDLLLTGVGQSGSVGQKLYF